MGAGRDADRKRFEKRLIFWLAVSYAVIFLMTAAIMLYAAAPFFWSAGSRR